MIKKKLTEDLKSKNITFDREGIKYQILTFYQVKMTLDIIELNNTEKKGIQNIPFAYLPKSTKKIIKPA